MELLLVLLSGTNYDSLLFICAEVTTTLCQNTSIKCKLMCFPEKQPESLFIFTHFFSALYASNSVQHPLHWSEPIWQVHWQNRLNTIIKCDMSPLRRALQCYYWKCCSQMKASWLWGGYFGVSPKPQASTGLCCYVWSSTGDILLNADGLSPHHDDKSPLKSMGRFSVWQLQLYQLMQNSTAFVVCMCLSEVVKGPKSDKKCITQMYLFVHLLKHFMNGNICN